MFCCAGLDLAAGNTWNGCQVDGDIEHRDKLDDDPDGKRAFTADEVNEKESTYERRHKFDNTEDSGGKELFRRASSAQESEELRGVDGD